MDSHTPIEPDAVRTPGELPRLMNYPKSRYITICGDERCARDIHFDQIPPTVCMHGRRYFLDRDYESAKRITADNPTGGPRRLVSRSPKPDKIIDYTKLSPSAPSEPDPPTTIQAGDVMTSPTTSLAPEPPDDPELAEIFG